MAVYIENQDTLTLTDIFKSKTLDLKFRGISSEKIVPLDLQLPILTHYLQNKNTEFGKCLEAKATELIKEIYSKSLIGSVVSEGEIPYSLFSDFFAVPFPPKNNPKFTFIDLFAGIGGFRMALQNLGGKCVFSSEWDENAKKTYLFNYGEVPFGDITKESTKSYIPNGFDILCAGFPCQAFSIAGHRQGFEDTRGTLFFDVVDIIAKRRPKVVFLENVKNLQSHDGGKTFSIMKEKITELGYVVNYMVMNASEYSNTPQNRERIFIVCFDPIKVKKYKEFNFPSKEPLLKTIHDCIDNSIDDAKYFYTDSMGHYEELKKEIIDSDSIYQWRRQYVRKNQSHVCPTLTANMGTGGHNVPLIKVKKGIRKLSPKECLNFQGYPSKFNFPEQISNGAKYKQAGNSVVVPLIQKICQNIIPLI